MQGFCFALLQYSPIQTFLAAFIPSMQSLYSPRRKTAHRVLQTPFRLFAVFPPLLFVCASGYTAPTAPRWSVSQRRNTSSVYQIPATRRALHRSAQPPYYNKVYKGAPLLWIHARQCSKSQTMPARRGGSLASAAPGAPAKGSTSPPVQGQPGGMDTAGGAEPLTATAVSLFGLSPDSQ